MEIMISAGRSNYILRRSGTGFTMLCIATPLLAERKIMSTCAMYASKHEALFSS